MGMFDHIIYKGEVYQSKDLDCLLQDYRIAEDGRLLTDEYDIIFEEGKKITKKDVDTKYHGMLYFYGEENGRWVDYTAKFTNGNLVSITREEKDFIDD